MDALIDELKNQIIKVLSLEDITPADIKTDEPIFGTGLGLDSIDSLELVSLLERDYGILIEEMSVAQKAFPSLRPLGEFVAQNRKR